jgi:hypothetical protein
LFKEVSKKEEGALNQPMRQSDAAFNGHSDASLAPEAERECAFPEASCDRTFDPAPPRPWNSPLKVAHPLGYVYPY